MTSGDAGPDPVLEADGVGKSFGGKAVLRAAGFRARAGVVTALMGRNGSGKTTLLRIAAGRIRSDHGRVLFRGTCIPRPRLARLAVQGLFYSAQDSALTDLFSLREQLDAVERVWGAGRDRAEILESMRLGELIDRRPREVSGGERQRATLAMALLRHPVCLLMDEPFAGVAPKDVPLVAAGLRMLRDAGCAVVVTGHEVADLFALADEIVWVVAGTTHGLGPPGQAALHHQFRREYLGASWRAGPAQGPQLHPPVDPGTAGTTSAEDGD